MPPKKIKKSAFLVTYVTNSTDIKLKEPLKKAWAYVIDHLEDYIKHKIQGGGMYDYAVNPELDHLIDFKTMRAKAGIEINKKQKYIHIHAALELAHKSNIQINRVKLHADMNKMLGTSGHLNIIGQPATSAFDNFEAYVEKEQNVAQ